MLGNSQYPGYDYRHHWVIVAVLFTGMCECLQNNTWIERRRKRIYPCTSITSACVLNGLVQKLYYYYFFFLLLSRSVCFRLCGFLSVLFRLLFSLLYYLLFVRVFFSLLVVCSLLLLVFLFASSSLEFK